MNLFKRRILLPRGNSERGVALIITLVILSMLLFLLITFLSSVRVERTISRSTSDQTRARLAAQAAVQRGINDLAIATTNENYITMSDNPNWAAPATQQPVLEVWRVVPGSASLVGTMASLTSTLETPSFNKAEMIGASNHLATPFSFTWTYITNGGVTMARYAYWADDESMKINLATSGTNVAMFGGSAEEVGMAWLPNIANPSAVNIVSGRGSGFETLETVRDFLNIDHHGYNTAKYYSTIYSRDSRTSINYLGGDLTNINVLAAQDIVTIANTLAALCPAVANKYGLQFAANLKEYVNPNRQPYPLVTINGTNILGRNSTPYINEFTLQTRLNFTSMANGTNQFTCTNTVSVELFNIYSTSYPHTNGAKIKIAAIPAAVISNASDGTTVPIIWPSEIAISGSVNPASCVTYSTNVVMYGQGFSTNGYSGVFLVVPGSSAILVSFTNSAGLVDYSNIGVDSQSSGLTPIFPPVANGVPVALAVPYLLTTNKAVVFPGDPRINHETNLWAYAAATPNAMNALCDPRAGFDADTNVWVDGGYYFRNGPMQSIAEIGQISVGRSSINDMWHTLKLYGDGNASGANTEDYWLLDYITTTNAGRPKVNLNAAREYPINDQGVLASLLGNATIATNATAQSTGDFITLSSILGTLPRRLATNIVAVAQTVGPYRSVGHFVQLNSNLLSTASGANQTTDWRREAPLRSIANALTTRGEQFTIYGLGQSIQISPGGRVTNVLGEAFLQTVVERVVLPGALPPTNIYYRPLYNRFLIE